MSYTIDKSLRFWTGNVIVRNDYSPGYNGYKSNYYLTLTRSITGNKNPNWRQQVEKMENATTDFSGTWQSVKAVAHSLNTVMYTKDRTWGPYTFQCTGYLHVYMFGYFAWQTWSSSADAKASNSFLGKVRESRVRVSGPTFLGEIRETISMIRRPASVMLDFLNDYVSRVKAIKRQRKRRPTEWINKAGDLWLEGTFGWVPLMRDIQDAKDAYNSLIDKDRVVYISAGGVDQKKFPDELTYTTYPGTGSWLQIMLASENAFNRHIVRYRGAMLAQAATTARDRFARFGFTPSEFAPTAWELLPWSFLIDYFASIGDVITGLVTDTSQVRWVNKSEVKIASRDTRAYIRHPRSDWPQFVYDDFSSPGTATIVSRTVKRSVGVNIPTPSLHFKLQQSDMHLANIAGLLATVGLSIHPQHPRPKTYRL